MLAQRPNDFWIQNCSSSTSPPFSVLYFLCYYFFLSEQKKKISTVFLYAGSSLLGGMLSAATALPALYAMRDGKTSIDLDVLHNHSALFAFIDMHGVVGEVTVGMNNLIKASLAIICIALGVAIPNVFFRRFIADNRKRKLLNMLVERKKKNGEFVDLHEVEIK